MWPSQCWGGLQGSPRSLCLKQSLKCWVLVFPLQTPQQQSAPTVLMTASPPLSHHGYITYLNCLLSKSCLNKFFLHPLSSCLRSAWMHLTCSLMCTSFIWFSTSLFIFSPQDENNSVSNQKVDVLRRMLSRETQELQVSITFTVTSCLLLYIIKSC